MIANAIQAGMRGMRRRWPLIFLVYGMNLVVGLVLAIPLYAALDQIVSGTGFGPDLARQFDLVLWADIGEKLAPVLSALLAQLAWMIPLWLVWKTAQGVGLVHALRGQQIRPFWQGVGRYTGRGLLLALVFLPLVAGVVLLTLLLLIVLNLIWDGEVGSFWINGIVAPILFVIGFAKLNAMHDYARVALVLDRESVLKAAWTGIVWPFFKHRGALLVYAAWWLPALALWLLPGLMDLTFTAGTGSAIWGLFLLQQAALLARAAVTVGWVGSETAYYEDITWREVPLIAEDDTIPAPDDPAWQQA